MYTVKPIVINDTYLRCMLGNIIMEPPVLEAILKISNSKEVSNIYSLLHTVITQYSTMYTHYCDDEKHLYSQCVNDQLSYFNTIFQRDLYTDIVIVDTNDLMYHYPESKGSFDHPFRILVDCYEYVFCLLMEHYNSDHCSELLDKVIMVIDKLLGMIDIAILAMMDPHVKSEVGSFVMGVKYIQGLGIVLYLV